MTNMEKQLIADIEERYENHGKISIGRVRAIMYMANHEIWPDGSFSDDECGLWSDFRKMHNR